jgi:hypothetical protein
MTPVVGVFKTRADAESSSAALKSAEIAKSKIHLLTPETTKAELASVPTQEAEQPGMGKAMGAVVGGAMGLAGGLEVAELLATLLPGVGAIVAIGLSGSAILAALGAFGGGAIGGALENSIFTDLPEDELFVYKDALRKGRSVLIVTADSGKEETLVREKLKEAGAESIDQARQDWWLGLRNVEKEKYEVGGGDFDEDESEFRAGFEASHHPENENKTYEQADPQLSTQYPEIHDSPAFRLGYQRGRTRHMESKKTVN